MKSISAQEQNDAMSTVLVREMARAPARVVELGGCVALFLVLGSAWALSIPPAEPPDEVFHLMYGAHLARTGRLPVMQPPDVIEVPVEGNQPPLYYAATALVLRLTGLGDLAVGIPPRNPRSTKRGGAEASVYDHRAAGYPWPEIERATRLVRLAFLPLGAVVVASAYGAAAILRPQHPSAPLLAGGLAATVPQFTFIMGSVTNDTLANALAAVALLVMVAAVVLVGTDDRAVLLLGALLGLGLMTKMTLVALVPAAVWAVWFGGPRAGRTRRALLLVGVIAVVAAPVLLYFQLNHGDPFGLELNRRMFPQRVHSPDLAYFVGTFAPALFFSFWGVFGHMNVHLGSGYIAFAALTAASVVGMVRRFRRGELGPEARRFLALAGVALVAVLAGIVRYNFMFPQPQGRYVFPVLAVLAVLFAEGASAFVDCRRGATAVVVSLAAANAAVLVWVVLPAYRE